MIWAAQYVGLPYKRYGRAREGIDCWGLCMLVYKEQLKIALPDLSDVYNGSNKNERKQAINATYQSQKPAWIPVEDIKAFDVIAFQLQGIVNHVGVAIDDSYILHIEDNTGSVVQRYADLRHRISEVYRAN
jgi:cell wall-associated NlpC family hydrolase